MDDQATTLADGYGLGRNKPRESSRLSDLMEHGSRVRQQ